jgi:hypothetical protein
MVQVSDFRVFMDDTLKVESIPISSSKLMFDLYPNPSRDSFTIGLNEGSLAIYTMYTLQGVPIKSGNIRNMQEVQITGISAGIYLVEVMLDNVKIIKKIVIY